MLRLSRDTYLDAWSAALFAGGLATAAGLEDVSRAVRGAPAPAASPRPSDLLLDGFARVFTDGRSEATPMLERATSAFSGSTVSVALNDAAGARILLATKPVGFKRYL